MLCSTAGDGTSTQQHKEGLGAAGGGGWGVKAIVETDTVADCIRTKWP